MATEQFTTSDTGTNTETYTQGDLPPLLDSIDIGTDRRLPEYNLEPIRTVAGLAEQYRVETQQLRDGERQDGTYMDAPEVCDVLAESKYSLDELGEYVHAMYEQKTTLKSLSTHETQDYTYASELGVLSAVPHKQLTALYNSEESGPVIRSMIGVTIRSKETWGLTNASSFFMQLYGCEGRLSALADVAINNDPLVRELFKKPYSSRIRAD